MVITITLNPLLEKRYFVDTFEKGKTYRVLHSEYAAGGKGVNVSRELNLLGIKNLAVVPIGGNNGKTYRQVLEHEGINYYAFSVKSEMREAALIIENEKRVTTFIGESAPFSETEIRKIIEKTNKTYENSSVILFAGSVPNEEAAEIICEGIKRGNELDKITFLDTYGAHLARCLDARPFAVHNNVAETEKSLGISLASEKEKIAYLTSLYEKGIKHAYLTDGRNPAYAMKFGYLYKIIPPEIDEIDPTGSGDVFVAGVIHGIEKDNVFNDFVKYAIALASKNAAKLETAKVKFDEADDLTTKVEIKEIGRKMKVIDDSPNY
jgi:1-phosphofructokinase family hexose kinase